MPSIRRRKPAGSAHHFGLGREFADVFPGVVLSNRLRFAAFYRPGGMTGLFHSQAMCFPTPSRSGNIALSLMPISFSSARIGSLTSFEMMILSRIECFPPPPLGLFIVGDSVMSFSLPNRKNLEP